MRRILLFSALLLCYSYTCLWGQVKREINLSSDQDWTMQIDGQGEWLKVKVPYGGWNSDRQYKLLDENKDVKDYVVYKRLLKAPSGIEKSIAKLSFGAVNFGAEVYVDGVLVGEHHSTFTAFSIDITRFLREKAECTLLVKAYVLNHYKNKKGEYTMPTGYIYDSKLVKYPFGIARYVRLDLYPEVYISEVFVRPSVTTRTLSYDLTVCNESNLRQHITLQSALQSWNKKAFAYPRIPSRTVVLNAHETKAITVDVPWNLGIDSFWWPNIPFREDYVATLHHLCLTLLDGSGHSLFTTKQRFGFVEHAEGPYYYTVNGVRVNMPSDASAATQGCVYDAYAEAEAYKYSADKNKGCQLTWKKYMRMGIRANRTHQEPPTQNMLDAADEVGFLLIPETAIRGSHYPQTYTPNNNYRQHIEDMVRECRNHPSVARYSLSNEMDAIPPLLDMALPLDATRPYVYESNTHNKTTRVVSTLGHAYVMTHYVDYPRPASGIYGLGEYAWDTDGINEFASQGKLMRMNDICYFSGWSWTNYWPNFLEGWSHDTYAWQQNNHADRHDGVDGWNSPLIRYVQKSLSPYLICDSEIERMNRFSTDWPSTVPYLKPLSSTSRDIYIFNDGLFGDRLLFTWQWRWDSPSGDLLQEHSEDLRVKPGFYAHRHLSFDVPSIGVKESRKLYLVLSSTKDGKVVFQENSLWYNVTDSKPVNDIRLLSSDSTTQGDWKGKYGKDGYEIIGADKKVPGYAKVEYDRNNIYHWADTTDDKRALQRFVNDGNAGISRIASSLSRYGTVNITIDVGNAYKQVAVYILGWDTNGKMPIHVPETNSDFSADGIMNGKYLVFKVRGKVTLVIGDERVSRVSGIFFDSL
jgi:hypothetical protein